MPGLRKFVPVVLLGGNAAATSALIITHETIDDRVAAFRPLILTALVSCALSALWLGRHWKGQAQVVDQRARLAVSRKQIRQLLEQRTVQMVFQPILDIKDRRIVGAEALARVLMEPFAPPDYWFAAAARVGLAVDLELMAVEKALVAGRDLPTDIYLSLNASPATILSGRLEAVLLESGWDFRRLVLEITEHAAIDDYPAIRAALASLRDCRMRLSIDDAGAGYASFQHILQLRPEFIKLDRSVITDIDIDPAKRGLAAGVVTFAREIGATIIAEGVENARELDALAQLGLRCAQGYHISGPRPAGPRWTNYVNSGATPPTATEKCDESSKL